MLFQADDYSPLSSFQMPSLSELIEAKKIVEINIDAG